VGAAGEVGGVDAVMDSVAAVENLGGVVAAADVDEAPLEAIKLIMAIAFTTPLRPLPTSNYPMIQL